MLNVIKPPSLFIALISIASTSFAGIPLWTYTLSSGNNVQSIAENVTGTIRYKITNQAHRVKTLALAPTAGLVQMTPCQLAPHGFPGDSCEVTLKIIGNLVPAWGIQGGPSFCQANLDGSANRNQCYEPSIYDALSITKAKKLDDWSNWGQNIQNNHHNMNSGITRDNVEKIAALCKIDYTQGLTLTSSNTTSFSNSAKPVIVKDTLYWTGFAGKIGAHKILRDEYGNFQGCNQLWVQDVSNLLGLSPVSGGTPSVRSSAAYYERANGAGTLLYTAIDNPFSLPFPTWFTTPPMAFAIDAASGAMLWKIDLVNPSEVAVGGAAVIPSTTDSPRVYNNTAYLGFSSYNNGVDNIPLTFRGHMLAIDLGGQGMMPSIKWTQYTVPAPPASYAPGQWFAGGGVWASTPSIIPELGLVIFGAGQLYNYPDFAAACMERPEPVTTPTFTTTKKGETGIGAQQCLQETEAKLLELGVTQPLATNSVIALSMQDGSFVWHVSTSGLDSWQTDCGLNGNVPCNVPVPGPDWDVGGSSPIVADLKSLGKVVISHNKGGELFWIQAVTGQLLRREDICVGSSLGGTHWGLSYDPEGETIYVPCSAGGIVPTQGGAVNFMSILANGRKTCMTGYLNAIDANTGQLKWQTLPASSEIIDVNSPGCPDQFYYNDERFKYGLNFDLVIKNNQFNVPVNIMPNSSNIPLANQQKARSNGVPASSNNIVYWPVYYGMVYALDALTGAYLNQFPCDQGAMYTAGPSVAKGLVMFGCGYGNFNPVDIGKSIMIYGLPNISTTETDPRG
ncbi:membrane-bound PQQ-dependent dehydrogenase, glucose/quinate/shikimate family [Legionella massiliensis]|uniref:Membrane-bound PQQ-dependent dehydrogenase, glucose/quinate/shikimate family n=1 Tax=Legionella massiliensis TaxID=1034943 RepID=A0A078KWZ7_9GAMM|nr:hypothetical protein [Legionella massiliensis]CDZ77557.1 membrane-bound PQQ-dependent dehydrogenase, glucose/quinate/shikimate family [Legionella massiliensis]CEE13295.1 Outer membrane protein assembly factor BamB [Legionella massiliensis]